MSLCGRFRLKVASELLRCLDFSPTMETIDIQRPESYGEEAKVVIWQGKNYHIVPLCICIYIYIYVYIYIFVYVKYIYTYSVCIWIYIYMYRFNIYVYIYIYTRIYRLYPSNMVGSRYQVCMVGYIWAPSNFDTPPGILKAQELTTRELCRSRNCSGFQVGSYQMYYCNVGIAITNHPFLMVYTCL